MSRSFKIATWIKSLDWAQIPGSLLDKAADHYLDTLGALIAGSKSPSTKVAEAVFTSPGSSHLFLSTDHTRSAVDATRINAIAAHSLEIDDTEGLDHSGAVVIPVILALSDMDPSISRRQKLVALIAGYEVGRRVQSSLGGYAAHNSSGWHSTATCGVFAAAVSAGVLLRLDTQELAHSLGIASSMSAGSWAFSDNAAMTKQMHPGFAAGNGLIAAQIAAAGGTGPLHIFEDIWGGFYNTHGNDLSDPLQLTTDLGRSWAFSHSAIKPYASCRSAHSAIDALAKALREHRFDKDAIRSISVFLDPYLFSMIGALKVTSEAQARMSLPVSLALLLDDHDLLPWDYSLEKINNARPWLERIDVIALEKMRGREPLLRVATFSGELFELTQGFAPGGENDPMSREEVIQKFRTLTARAITTTRQDELIDAALEVDPLETSTR